MSVIYLGYRGPINAHRNDTVAAVQAYSVLVNRLLLARNRRIVHSILESMCTEVV